MEERLGNLELYEDSCATVPSVHHMINKTSLLRARDSRHGRALANPLFNPLSHRIEYDIAAQFEEMTLLLY